MVDNDGRETYSSVIFIRTTSKTKISVTNNPFKDMIALQYNISKDELLSISLFNVSGALLKKVQYKATAGSGAYTLYGVGNNATGIYFLRVEAGEYRQSFKLFKN